MRIALSECDRSKPGAPNQSAFIPLYGGAGGGQPPGTLATNGRASAAAPGTCLAQTPGARHQLIGRVVRWLPW